MKHPLVEKIRCLFAVTDRELLLFGGILLLLALGGLARFRALRNERPGPAQGPGLLTLEEELRR
ncbi:MAG: hypothetical protein U1E27_05600 [Kiritimatiellia bacterium]|nr:hypothetical protein [Kiritimatiellia bacterium]